MATIGPLAFTGANGTNLTGWDNHKVVIEIQSNQATGETTGDILHSEYETDLDSSNHWVQAEVNLSGNEGYVLARHNNATGISDADCYCAEYNGAWTGSLGWALGKIVNGVLTVLDSMEPGGSADPATVYIEVDGATQEATLDGVNTLSATDSAITTGTRIGLRNGWENGCLFDDLEASDLAAASDVFFENRHPIDMGMKPHTAAGMGGVLIQ